MIVGMMVLHRLIKWVKEWRSSGFRLILHLFVLRSELFGLTRSTYPPADKCSIYSVVKQVVCFFSIQCIACVNIATIYRVSSSLAWDEKLVPSCFPLSCVLCGLQVVLAGRGVSPHLQEADKKTTLLCRWNLPAARVCQIPFWRTTTFLNNPTVPDSSHESGLFCVFCPSCVFGLVN